MTTAINATIRERVRRIEDHALHSRHFSAAAGAAECAAGASEDRRSGEAGVLRQHHRRAMPAGGEFAAVRPGQVPGIDQGSGDQPGTAPGRNHSSDLLPGQAFPAKNWALDPSVFWTAFAGCAMVCRKFSEKLAADDGDKAYMAGLLHDIGFLVNCMVFPEEFDAGRRTARAGNRFRWTRPNCATMGFTHCETGRALAEKWHLAADMVQVIAHHHAPEQSEAAQPLVALVHLSDLLCRMRGLGYGYYERAKWIWPHDPAWAFLLKEHRGLEGSTWCGLLSNWTKLAGDLSNWWPPSSVGRRSPPRM